MLTLFYNSKKISMTLHITSLASFFWSCTIFAVQHRAIPASVLVWLLTAGCGGDKDSASELDLVGDRERQSAPVSSVPAPAERKVKEAKRQPPGSVFAVDLIQDLVFRRERDGWSLTSKEAHVNLAKLKTGGIDLVISALPLIPGKQPRHALEHALKVNEDLVAGTGGAVEIVTSFNAARAARERDVIPMRLLLEGADALEGRLESVAELRRRGLAIVGIVAGQGNAFADAAVAPREQGGLTEQGRALLEVCRDQDLIVDLTHASPLTFWDVLIEQTGVVVVSHTAARALRDHPRNLNDLQILALARYGGVMGLIFNPDFLEPASRAPTTLSDVVSHVAHVKSIGAISALALGTDFGGIHPPRGLEDVSRIPALARALERQGMGDEEIAGVLGNNAARLFEDVERKRGALRYSRDEILRPLDVDCDGVIGEFEGSPALACNRYLLDRGPTLPPTSRQKIRLRDMSSQTVRLELFGDVGTPWQVEGQNLAGKVLFTRIVALDENGRGELSLPSGRNLTRLFCSPTRTSSLREVVVWGR